ncbi:hypothetical protein VTH06DRAFT_1412 [Thermothelomyces fergusii]
MAAAAAASSFYFSSCYGCAVVLFLSFCVLLHCGFAARLQGDPAAPPSLPAPFLPPLISHDTHDTRRAPRVRVLLQIPSGL